MRKAGQTWHIVAKRYIEGKHEIRPRDMANDLDISFTKAGSLLRSLGWIRSWRIDSQNNTKYTVYRRTQQ